MNNGQIPAHVVSMVREYWNGAAERYDTSAGHGLSEAERWAWRRVLGLVLEPLTTEAKQPLQVLDVGTGTGEMATLLANMGHRVTGVDLSPEMLGRARAKAERLGLPVRFHEGSADALPFPAATFDAVFSRHLFWTLPLPEAAVREWARVTRPGGLVVIADGWWLEPGRVQELRRACGKLLRRVLERHTAADAMYASINSALPIAGGVSPYSIRYYLSSADLDHIRVKDLRSVRRAERRARPFWHRIDQSRYTWLASAQRPQLD